MRKRNKGFTLIELLVVVLVIGILAAIALPEYQFSVLKSRAGQIESLVRSISQAQESYFLAHSRYATNFNDLDLVIPSSTACKSNGERCRQVGDWSFSMYCPDGGNSCESIEAEYYENKDASFLFKIGYYFLNKRAGNSIREQAGNLTCIAGSSGTQKTKGQRICVALGGQLIPNSEDRYYRL